MIIAVDWANEAEAISVFDGKKLTHRMPKPSKDLVIVTENIPLRQAKPYLDAGVQIFRCNTNVVAKEREFQGLVKSHDIDVKLIYEIYQKDPDLFREFKVDPLLQQFKALYSTFKSLQKLRVATGNQLYSDDDPLTESILIGLEKQEEAILKGLKASLEQMPIYAEFLSQIKGVGPATSAGLLAFVGDIERFPSVSHLMSYFGLDVRDGKAPKRAKGQVANWHHRGRSLLLGVIGDSFIKQRTPIYRDMYDAEKAIQLEICERKIHAERRAIRKAVKQFVKDFYSAYKQYGRGLVEMEKLEADAPRSKSRKKLAAKKAKKAELVLA